MNEQAIVVICIIIGALIIIGVALAIFFTWTNSRRQAYSISQEPTPAILNISENKHGLYKRLRRLGWSFDGERYHGYFRTRSRVWKGIIEYRNGNYEVYIRDPPESVLNGKKGVCLKDVGNGWFWVHQNTQKDGVLETIRATDGFFVRHSQEGQLV